MGVFAPLMTNARKEELERKHPVGTPACRLQTPVSAGPVQPSTTIVTHNREREGGKRKKNEQ